MANISHQKARSLILLASESVLTPRDQQTLDAHLETCGTCKTYIQTLAATQQKLQRTLHRRWDTARARISIQQIHTGSRRTLMFKKLTITAGTLAVVVVLALAIFSISGSLSPKKITASNITTTPTPLPIHPSQPIQLGPQNSMSVADWSPDGKRLIIRNEGELLLYVVNRDGSGLTKLPDLHARSAHWSADGNSIRICVNPPDDPKKSKIFSVFPDASNLKELPDEEKVAALMDGNCDPVYSPDRKTIAFRKSDGLGLYFMDANGENIRQVIDSAEQDVVIHKWTVDAAGNTSLLFSSLNPGSDLTLKQLNRITLNNAGASVLSEGLRQFSSAESAFWRISPDGQKIIFIPNSPNGIYADDDGWKKLVDLPLPDYFEQTVLWSPDSSQFAFMSTITGDSDVFVVNADGSNLRHYPNPNALDQVVSWSPDGLSLVFSSQAKPLTPPLYLYLLDVKDLQPYADPRFVTATPTKPIPTASPTPIQFDSNQIRVGDSSPDGRRLILFDGQSLFIYDFTRPDNQLRKLTDLAVNQYAHWAADGNTIILCASAANAPSAARKVFSVFPDGSHLTEQPGLTKVFKMMIEQESDNCEPMYLPTYSPDGKRIAFVKTIHSHGLYLVDANGENLRQVIGDDYTGIYIHRWTQDASGSSITFVGVDLRNGEASMPNVYNAKIDRADNIVSIDKLYQLQATQMTNFTLSSDARHMLYRTDSGKIFRVDFADDGSQTEQPIADVNLPYPSLIWSPDAAQIAFTSNVTGDIDIFVINANGSNLRYYPNLGLDDDIIQWTADGRSLVFRSDGKSSFSLNMVDVSNLQLYADLQPITGPGACTLAPLQYVAVKDDSLPAISAKFGVSVQRIIALNKFDTDGIIPASGQVLLVPQPPDKLSRGVIYITVTNNDMLVNIAARFKVSTESIILVNSLDAKGTLTAGQQLAILFFIKPTESDDAKLNWPVVKSDHQRFVDGYSETHPGLDIVANAGDAVLAADEGFVTFAGATDGDLGNTIIIQHRNGIESIYAHLAEVHVSCFESVRASQAIGSVGQAGVVPPNPFLYFILRQNGYVINPQTFLP